MKPKTCLLPFALALGLLLAALILPGDRPARAAAAIPAAAGDDALRPTDTITVTTLIISNEAPGYLVDYLIAQGHGDETLLQVLAYLRDQSGGVISGAFYNQAAAAPPGSEVFTARLGDYAGLTGGIEIAADGTINIASVKAIDYDGAPGYSTAPGQDAGIVFTYALDPAHYIFTHGFNYGGSAARNYYAFAIAWRNPKTIFLPVVLK